VRRPEGGNRSRAAVSFAGTTWEEAFLKRVQTQDFLSTRDEAYSVQCEARESVWWKRLLDVQAPYRWNLQRLQPGFTLDLGCGNGRSLRNLKGHGVGIDHNPRSVQVARAVGFQAFTPEEFEQSLFNVSESFDSILLSHVAEHMTEEEAIRLLKAHLHLLKPQGKVILFCPQEAGFRSDPTHVQFMDFDALRRISEAAGLVPEREYSFPLPRRCGRFFRYNEFVSVSRKPLAP
jgi:SAM-dependent methyltransferase